jgi:hypothetical protein
MKRLIAILAALGICVALSAQQGNVTTRKYRFSDFTDKITKVVMTGGEILDGALRQEVVDGWTVSPFEFCSAAEYESLKRSDAYYFLLVTAGMASAVIEGISVFFRQNAQRKSIGAVDNLFGIS